MSVSEDKVPGEEVGRLKAKDPDLGDNGLVNYRIIDGDGIGMFELSTDSETREAVIKLKKVRNGYNQPKHRLPYTGLTYQSISKCKVGGENDHYQTYATSCKEGCLVLSSRQTMAENVTMATAVAP